MNFSGTQTQFSPKKKNKNNNIILNYKKKKSSQKNPQQFKFLTSESNLSFKREAFKRNWQKWKDRIIEKEKSIRSISFQIQNLPSFSNPYFPEKQTNKTRKQIHVFKLNPSKFTFSIPLFNNKKFCLFNSFSFVSLSHRSPKPSENHPTICLNPQHLYHWPLSPNLSVNTHFATGYCRFPLNHLKTGSS